MNRGNLPPRQQRIRMSCALTGKQASGTTTGSILNRLRPRFPITPCRRCTICCRRLRPHSRPDSAAVIERRRFDAQRTEVNVTLGAMMHLVLHHVLYRVVTAALEDAERLLDSPEPVSADLRPDRPDTLRI